MPKKAQKNPDKVPRTSKDSRYSDEAYQNFMEYQLDWKKKSVKQIHLHYDLETDADILRWLDTRENRTDYIRTLIRKDIAHCKRQKLDPNSLRAKYDTERSHTRRSDGEGKRPKTSVIMHLNKVNDADIVAWLEDIKNKQAYIRRLIRYDIETLRKSGVSIENVTYKKKTPGERKPNKTMLLYMNGTTDSDIIVWLEAIPKKQDYIRKLIRTDIEICRKIGITPEERIKKMK